MTYGDHEIEDIATAIDCNVEKVEEFRSKLEAAVVWLRLDRRAPARNDAYRCLGWKKSSSNFAPIFSL